MGDDTRKGLLRVGADFFGGPTDTVVSLIQQAQPKPGTVFHRLAKATGLPATKKLDPKKMPGTSDWIAEKTGIGGDSKEYNAARVAGNLGLMFLPSAVNTVRNFNPRKGDLNMWIGPKAKDYDTAKADEVKADFAGYRKTVEELMGRPITAAEVDHYNTKSMQNRRAIVEPVSGQVLFFSQDLDKVPQYGLDFFSQAVPQDWTPLGTIYPNKNLDRYQDLDGLPVKTRPDGIAAFTSVTQDSLPEFQRIHGDSVGGWISVNPTAIDRSQRPQGEVAEWLRHETEHNLQRIEGRPVGGSPQTAALLGARTVALPDSTHPDVGVDLGRQDAAVAAIANPTKAYDRIHGERMANSVEFHGYNPDEMPQLMKPGYMVPKLENSLIVEEGFLNPIELYLSGRLQYDPTRAGLKQYTSPKLGEDAKAIVGQRDLPSVKPRGEAALGLLSPALARLLAEGRKESP